MKKNNIQYRFSVEEVEAVATLIKWAQEYKKKEARPIVQTVASAFNRHAFGILGIENDCQESEKCGIISKNNNMQMRQPTQKEIDKIKKSVENYQKANEALLKKHKLESRIVISFPTHRKVPFFGRFAMWLLNKNRAILDLEFKSFKK